KFRPIPPKGVENEFSCGLYPGATMKRVLWNVFLAFALASVPVQAQGYQGGPGSRGFGELNGNRPGAGIMGGGPMCRGAACRRPSLTNLRGTPGNPDWWKPHGLPDDIKVPQISPEALRTLNHKFDGLPFSLSNSDKPKSKSSWPAWVCWESALGVFAA